MKRMHIHVGVDRLDDSIRFYSVLFDAKPAKIKPDYAKWMLDDPCINFAISTRASTGVDHLGLQVEEEQELDALRQRLKTADLSLLDEGETVCCYARSNKSWVTDPAGIAWEAYQSMEDVQLFSDAPDADEDTCCAPHPSDQTDGCGPTEKTSGCCG